MSREISVPTPTARLHEVTLAALNRTPAPPESSVSITRNAKGAAQFEVVVRGTNIVTCEQTARAIFDGLAAAYPYPETNGAA